MIAMHGVGLGLHLARAVRTGMRQMHAVPCRLDDHGLGVRALDSRLSRAKGLISVLKILEGLKSVLKQERDLGVGS